MEHILKQTSMADDDGRRCLADCTIQFPTIARRRIDEGQKEQRRRSDNGPTDRLVSCCKGRRDDFSDQQNGDEFKRRQLTQFPLAKDAEAQSEDDVDNSDAEDQSEPLSLRRAKHLTET